MKVTAVLLISIIFVCANAKPTSRRIYLDSPHHLPTHRRTSIRKRTAPESQILRRIAIMLRIERERKIVEDFLKSTNNPKKRLSRCRTLKIIYKLKLDCRTLKRR